MPRFLKRRAVRWLIATALVAVAAEQAWRHGHDYLFPEKLAEVVPGRVYRGAWQHDGPMRQIVRDHKIRTIVALAHSPDHPLAVRERKLSEELGVHWIHVPIVDERSIHDRQALFDRLEQAAAVVADPANQPVYFHCHHGINRASMVHIAYRTLYDGWTLEQASDEVARLFGLQKVDKGPDYRHMAAFYEKRVLPMRQARAARGEGAAPAVR
jgi:hypothetical protein